MLPPLPEGAVVLGAVAGGLARAAVRLAGDALAASGAATAEYADDMVRMIEEHGPYVVIAAGPGPRALAARARRCWRTGSRW